MFGPVVSLLRPHGGAPLLLRIGGASADLTWWDARSRRPRNVEAIGAGWLSGLRSLIRAADVRLLLDVNVAAHSPRMAVAFVGAVRRALGPRTVAGLDIGNEPDLFPGQPWLAAQWPRHAPSWTTFYSPAAYQTQYRGYAAALHGAFPGIPLGAPNTTSPNPSWLASTSGLGALAPGFVAVHAYGFSTCFSRSSADYPSVPRLLDRAAPILLARWLAPALAFARAAAEPLRVTEFNAVSCAGGAGVANSYATALWAPDALVQLLSAGVTGVNVHVRANLRNAPFTLSHGRLHAAPELYGLALFATVARAGDRLVRTIVASPRGRQLDVWAVTGDARLTTVLTNTSPQAIWVRLPATADEAIVWRLRGRSPSATAGVRLAGRWIGSDGRWRGHRVESRVRESGGSVRVFVPPTSITVVNEPARPIPAPR